MSGTDVTSEVNGVGADTCDLKLEVVTLPVSDVDRAKNFYERLGWRLDADIVVGDNFRAVQFTPPRSSCSIAFGKGLTNAGPGTAQRLILVVADIDTARKGLVDRGVDVSDVFHLAGGRMPGPDPERRSYQSYASFSDPDGNGWLLQEITSPSWKRVGRLTCTTRLGGNRTQRQGGRDAERKHVTVFIRTCSEQHRDIEE